MEVRRRGEPDEWIFDQQTAIRWPGSGAREILDFSRNGGKSVSRKFPVAVWLQPAVPGSFDYVVRVRSDSAQDDSGGVFRKRHPVRLGRKVRCGRKRKVGTERKVECGGKRKEREWTEPSRKRMAPQVGLEPTTLRLTAGCSAIELLRSERVNRWCI
jgi:hypothetical protein